MTYEPVEVKTFTGLNLINDPQELVISGAVDCVNVDLDLQGRLRCRNGYASFAADANATFFQGSPFYISDGTRHFVVGLNDAVTGNEFRSYDSAGTLVATDTSLTLGSPYDFVQYGTPTAEYMFCANGGDTVRQYDGTAFSTPAYTGTTPTGRFLAKTADSNRLVVARIAANKSRVLFSDPDDPLTFGTDNYVDLGAGDGEEILGVASYDGQLFVFKQSRFFVLTGEGIDGTGGFIPNFRAVDGAGLSTIGGVCATEHGVFFLDRRGIYLTTGGPARKVSTVVEPIFTGDLPDTFTGAAVNWAPVTSQNWPNYVSMAYYRGKLLFAYPTTGETRPIVTLVFDPRSESWAYWRFPEGAYFSTFRKGDQPSLMLCHGGAVFYSDSSTTTDAGSNMSWHYQSGFFDLESPVEKVIRESAVWGTSAESLGVTLKMAVDHGAVDSGTAMTLGTTAPTRELVRASYRGRVFSHRLSGGRATTIHQLVHYVRAGRGR